MFSKEFLHQRLRQLRQERKLTINQLGVIFNTTKQTISRWELGDRTPSIEILAELAEYYDVSIDYLVGRTDNPNSHKS